DQKAVRPLVAIDAAGQFARNLAVRAARAVLIDDVEHDEFRILSRLSWHCSSLCRVASSHCRAPRLRASRWQSRHGFSARLSSISPYVRHNGRRAPPFARLAGRAPVRPFRLQRVPPLLRPRAPPASPLRPRALSFRPFRPRASAWRPHGPTHPLPAIAGVQRQPGRRLWRGIFPLPPSGLALPPFAVL